MSMVRGSFADIEAVLAELRGTIGLMSHLTESPLEVSEGSWAVVRDKLLDLHTELHEMWQRGWDERCAEREAHKLALEKAEARKAAPGSPVDREAADALWGLLGAWATMTTRQIAERLPPSPMPAEEVGFGSAEGDLAGRVPA